ncbi:MAG: alpha/beta fold hydrolase [Bacteroidota bacterium]
MAKKAKLFPLQWYGWCLLLLCLGCQLAPTDGIESEVITAHPLSIEGLRERSYASTLVFEKSLTITEAHTAELWSYKSDSLKIYALVNRPTTTPADEGFPILIFGHGFHPNPPKYGVSNATGKDWRPGDYYRGIPEAYAEKGFLVITPDYRGHNVSEGFPYTQTSFLATTYYAIDVLHLLSALPTLKAGNLDDIYYVGHSMGGEVGLKMLLATDQIKAASLWAPVSATIEEQALYYGNLYEENGMGINSKKMAVFMVKMDSIINNLSPKLDLQKVEAILAIQDLETPLIIHHARGDLSVPYQWSESLVAKLYQCQKSFELYDYDTDNHLFDGANRVKAVERDLAFFEK